MQKILLFGGIFAIFAQTFNTASVLFYLIVIGYSARECMNLVTHYLMQGGKHSVSRAMAGVELCLGIGIRQSEGQFRKFVFALMIVEQMESSHDGIHWEWTCSKDVL